MVGQQDQLLVQNSMCGQGAINGICTSCRWHPDWHDTSNIAVTFPVLILGYVYHTVSLSFLWKRVIKRACDHVDHSMHLIIVLIVLLELNFTSCEFLYIWWAAYSCVHCVSYVSYLSFHFLCYFFSNKGEDEMVEYFQNKYSGESVSRILGDGEDMSDEITQQGLLPGVKWVDTHIHSLLHVALLWFCTSLGFCWLSRLMYFAPNT